MIKKNLKSFKSKLLAATLTVSWLNCQQAVFCGVDERKDAIAVASSPSDDSVAPSANKNKSFMLQGKAEIIETKDNNMRAWQAAQTYKLGVSSLTEKRYAIAAGYFKSAGNAFAAIPGNEKFLAEAKFAEGQSRRLMGQKKAAYELYQEAIDLFRQYDPLSPYLQAALDNINSPARGVHGGVSLSDIRWKALTAATSIQAVERDVYLKGQATDLDANGQMHSGKATSDITEVSIKKTVLQAFVKMTCLETAELGSNYYTAADRYVPLKANGKALVIAASSGFLAPIIRIRLNGRFYNVGVDLPDLSNNRKNVYLVTDERNVLAIDPATYDVWKLYAKFDKQNGKFEWKKLTHTKDTPRRISPMAEDNTN